MPGGDDVNKTLEILGELYGLSVQELRDASFGPLTTGQADINLIVDSIEDFSRGGALLYRSKKYVEMLLAWNNKLTTTSVEAAIAEGSAIKTFL